MFQGHRYVLGPLDRQPYVFFNGAIRVTKVQRISKNRDWKGQWVSSTLLRQVLARANQLGRDDQATCLVCELRRQALCDAQQGAFRFPRSLRLLQSSGVQGGGSASIEPPPWYYFDLVCIKKWKRTRNLQADFLLVWESYNIGRSVVATEAIGLYMAIDLGRSNLRYKAASFTVGPGRV